MRYILKYQERLFTESVIFNTKYHWSVYEYNDLDKAIKMCDSLNHDYPTANYRVWDTAENKVAYPEVKE